MSSRYVSDDGSFTIPNVRPGNYQLHAVADGVLGAYDATASVTITPGQKLDLGSIEWHPTHYGRQVWQIGTPNRSAREFLKGDDHWHWGMYIEYAKLFLTMSTSPSASPTPQRTGSSIRFRTIPISSRMDATRAATP